MRRRQNTGQMEICFGQPGEDRAEPERNREAPSARSAETDRDDDAALVDMVFSKCNIEQAIAQVKSNKGAPGTDGMTVWELEEYWHRHGAEQERHIRALRYRPKPVRKVEIPKPNGGTRTLGIPCVADRMIQQAVAQVLVPIVDPAFSDRSYGFRPGRSAHQAVEEARRYYEEGYTTVVDIDLKSYFDTVNHDILMRLVEDKGVTDKVVLHIVRRSLAAGCMEGGVATQRTQGTPQGGPLSPLLSNIYLDVFDKEMEKRGHRFVRYADDVNIYVATPRAGNRVMESATRFLEGRLKLTVNPDKSEVGSPGRLKFLGFSLGRDGNGAFIRVHSSSARRLKDKIRQITKRNRGIPVARMLGELRRMLTGWLNYYAVARCKTLCENTAEWLRRRIRCYVWKQWKRPATRVRKLRSLKVGGQQAYEWGNTRKAYWRVSGSPILCRALNNTHLDSLGLFDMPKSYLKLHSGKRTAVYRTVRTVV